MIFRPVISGGGGSAPTEIEEFSVTVNGTAEGNIQVFDQSEQEWKTPTGAAMNIATGRNFLIKTKVDLMNHPSVKQGDLSLELSAAIEPLTPNTFGWYFPETSGFYGKSININANED